MSSCSRQRTALLLAWVALGGCDQATPPVAVEELDPRIQQFQRWVPHHGESGTLYFLDRFETRVADYRIAFPERRPGLARVDPELPISRIDAIEAIEVARYWWARLPREDEWLDSVRGRAGYRYPWGDRFGGALRANTAELGLWRAARVGSFESGRNPGRPGACYDLIGNMAEWTLTPGFEAPDGLVSDGFGSRELRGLQRMRALLGLQPSYDPVDPCIAAYPQGLRLRSHELAFLVITGHSFADRLQFTPYGMPIYRRLRSPLEWASTLGMRMATDPFTLLARLDATPGLPSAADERALRNFLQQHRDEFRAAFVSLDEPVLTSASAPAALRKPSAWGLAARRVLGL